MASAPERISASDQMLITRMEAEVVAAQRLQQFVSMHLSQTYRLREGDRIEDGTIIRSVPPEQP